MAKATSSTDDGLNARLTKAVSDLEQKTLELMGSLKEEGRKAEALAQENLWVTLLSALGIGLVLGLILGFTRR